MARMASERAWVVCRGETRLVVHRSVACVAGGRVPLSRCLGCRYLETSSGERMRDRWCTAVVATDSATFVMAPRASSRRMDSTPGSMA